MVSKRSLNQNGALVSCFHKQEEWKTQERFWRERGTYFLAFTRFCSRRLRVPLWTFSVALLLQFSISSGEPQCFSPKISESPWVCFMGLFVCFKPKENTVVEVFSIWGAVVSDLPIQHGYSQHEPFNLLLSNFNIPLWIQLSHMKFCCVRLSLKIEIYFLWLQLVESWGYNHLC